MTIPIPYVFAFVFVCLIPLAAFWVISARRGPPTDFHFGVFGLGAGIVGIAAAVMLRNQLFIWFMPGVAGTVAVVFGALKLGTWKRNDEFQRR